MKDHLSPEEKLLKLIRGEKKEKGQASGPVGEPAQKQAIMAPEDAKFPDKKRTQALSEKFFVPANLQKFLCWTIFILVFYLAAALIYPWIGLRDIKLPSVDVAKIQESQVIPQKETRPVEFYLQGIGKKELFGNSADGNPSSIAAEAESIKDINLVGVILGENPQAVIQDKKSEKTFYVSRGQFIGEYQVEEIKEGKVILNRKGQRFELSI